VTTRFDRKKVERRHKMKSAVLLAAFSVCLAGATSQSGESQKKPYKGPACLGEFCLIQTALPSEQALIEKYGPGTQIGAVRCYAVPEQKAYVHFGGQHDLPGKIVTVFVSRAQNCVTGSEKLARATRAFPAFETKEGVRLGDLERKVTEIYGRPSVKREGEDGLGQIVPHSLERQGEPFGENVLVYDSPLGELMQAKFYIHNGKVAAIYISCSE